MGLKEIRLLGDSVLREKAHRVTRFNDRIETLIEDMTETMRSAHGVGLAAPQVGVLQRVIVVETPKDEEETGSGQLYALVNPEIVRSSDERVDGVEGCLSIPGYVGEVTRHEKVTIEGQDLRGRTIRVKAQGFLARVFQHEIDHLEGILFIDKLTAPDRIWRVEEGEEEQVEAQTESAKLMSVAPASPVEVPQA